MDTLTLRTTGKGANKKRYNTNKLAKEYFYFPRKGC
jgi:hypothetical protein